MTETHPIGRLWIGLLVRWGWCLCSVKLSWLCYWIEDRFYWGDDDEYGTD